MGTKDQESEKMVSNEKENDMDPISFSTMPVSFLKYLRKVLKNHIFYT